jgi:colanic acid/amylovoran biosynthesis glycosyltransferase
MERQLLALGCPRETLVYSPYGINCTAFRSAADACPPPVFVSVGRFVEKKAPDLLLRAFALVVGARPATRGFPTSSSKAAPACSWTSRT